MGRPVGSPLGSTVHGRTARMSVVGVGHVLLRWVVRILRRRRVGRRARGGDVWIYCEAGVRLQAARAGTAIGMPVGQGQGRTGRLRHTSTARTLVGRGLIARRAVRVGLTVDVVGEVAGARRRWVEAVVGRGRGRGRVAGRSYLLPGRVLRGGGLVWRRSFRPRLGEDGKGRLQTWLRVLGSASVHGGRASDASVKGPRPAASKHEGDELASKSISG